MFCLPHKSTCSDTRLKPRGDKRRRAGFSRRGIMPIVIQPLAVLWTAVKPVGQHRALIANVIPKARRGIRPRSRCNFSTCDDWGLCVDPTKLQSGWSTARLMEVHANEQRPNPSLAERDYIHLRIWPLNGVFWQMIGMFFWSQRNCQCFAYK